MREGRTGGRVERRGEDGRGDVAYVPGGDRHHCYCIQQCLEP
jgi:hypothetical protein